MEKHARFAIHTCVIHLCSIVVVTNLMTLIGQKNNPCTVIAVLYIAFLVKILVLCNNLDQ